MKASYTIRTVIVALAMATASFLALPAQAEVGGHLSGYLNPSVTYPEAEFQRYVITNGNSTQDVRVVYPGDTCVGRKLDSPVLTANAALSDELLELTNTTRKRQGLKPLTSERALNIAAEGHATEMLTLVYLSHTSPTPGLTTTEERVTLAGTAATNVTENLYQGESSEALARQAVEAWLGSAESRSSLLDPRASHVGLGVVEKNGKVSVTLLVGR